MTTQHERAFIQTPTVSQKEKLQTPPHISWKKTDFLVKVGLQEELEDLHFYWNWNYSAVRSVKAVTENLENTEKKTCRKTWQNNKKKYRAAMKYDTTSRQ